MSETTETPIEEIDTIRMAFDEALESDPALTEDEVKMRMIHGGASFKNVTRLYNQYMVDAGLVMSREDREALAEKILNGVDLSKEKVFNDRVSEMVEQITGMTERSAMATIRAYGKRNEIDVFTRPKSEGEGRAGFIKRFFNMLRENPQMTEADANSIIQGIDGNEPTSPNVKRNTKRHQAVRQLVNDIAG